MKIIAKVNGLVQDESFLKDFDAQPRSALAVGKGNPRLSQVAVFTAIGLATQYALLMGEGLEVDSEVHEENFEKALHDLADPANMENPSFKAFVLASATATYSSFMIGADSSFKAISRQDLHKELADAYLEQVRAAADFILEKLEEVPVEAAA